MGIIIINAVSSPNDAVLSKTVFIPPYQTTNPKVKEEKISATGKNIELYQTVFNHAFLCLSLIFLNFSNSIFSLANNCKILIPVTLS